MFLSPFLVVALLVVELVGDFTYVLLGSRARIMPSAIGSTTVEVIRNQEHERLIAKYDIVRLWFVPEGSFAERKLQCIFEIIEVHNSRRMLSLV